MNRFDKPITLRWNLRNQESSSTFFQWIGRSVHRFEVHLGTLLVVVHFLEHPGRLKEGSKCCYFIILIFVSCSKYCFLKNNVCQVDAKYWNIHVISSETIQKVSKPQRCESCPFQRVSISFFQVRELTSFLLFREF